MDPSADVVTGATFRTGAGIGGGVLGKAAPGLGGGAFGAGAGLGMMILSAAGRGVAACGAAVLGAGVLGVAVLGADFGSTFGAVGLVAEGFAVFG